MMIPFTPYLQKRGRITVMDEREASIVNGEWSMVNRSFVEHDAFLWQAVPFKNIQYSMLNVQFSSTFLNENAQCSSTHLNIEH
jgi:hypothetical protein